MEYTLTERQLTDVLSEAVKIYLREEEDAYLYGAKPDGNIPMDIEKNLEGADIQINSAGSIHIERCKSEGDTVKVYDANDREVSFSRNELESLLNGEKINAVLLTPDDTSYDVFISIAHASGNQRIMRYMRDLQRGDKPIFGGSEID